MYYDVKSSQVMTNIVNDTDVRLKILKILTTQRRDVDTVNGYVTQLHLKKNAQSIQCKSFKEFIVELGYI